VLEIGMLRAMWRALETGLRTTLLGHEGGNSGHRQGLFLVSYRASARPYHVRRQRSSNNLARYYLRSTGPNIW
jgi:hypothetical protein